MRQPLRPRAQRARTNATTATQFRPSIRSRHPSHSILRAHSRHLPLYPFKVLIRMGSTTAVDESRYRVIINSVQAIQTSSNKLLMKEAFERANAKTALWDTASTMAELTTLANTLTNGWEGKMVAKAKFGSRGQGNTLISSATELATWAQGKNLNNFIYEKYMNYGLEYRLHVTERGYFYTCRKALRRDTPEELRWRHHDDTCVWLLETNPEFRRPNSWDDIVSNCQAALREIGADVLSFDVKVQKATLADGSARRYQDFILLECNSASSLGSPDNPDTPGVCAQRYIEELPLIINHKLRQ